MLARLEEKASYQTPASSPAASSEGVVIRPSMRASAWARPALAAESLRSSSTKSFSDAAEMDDLPDWLRELDSCHEDYNGVSTVAGAGEDDVPDWLKD